jgi:EPS-associated MarR family transcriptional regulator
MTRERSADRHEDIHFRILRMLEKNPKASQREIAEELGVSLGGVNYCLNALIQKGSIKIENFKRSTNKLGYMYVLTPEGLTHKAGLAVRFIKRKMAEYEAIKAEIESLKKDLGDGAAPPDQLS